MQRALVASAEIDLAPVDLAQELRQVLGDEIDRVQLERLGGGDALALPHRLLRPFDVARPALGDAFDERRGVVLQLLEHRVLLALLVFVGRAERHRMGRADVGGGRHRRHVRRHGQEYSGRPGASPGRAHPEHDRHLGVQLRLDDVAGRGEQAPGGVDPDDQRLDAPLLRSVDGGDQICARAGIDGAGELGVVHDGAGREQECEDHDAPPLGMGIRSLFITCFRSSHTLPFSAGLRSR